MDDTATRPHIDYRITAEQHRRAKVIADAAHLPVTSLARKAFLDWLDAQPQVIRTHSEQKETRK